MSLQERKRALETARQHWQGAILNNISSCCLADCLELLQHSQQQIKGDQVSTCRPLLGHTQCSSSRLCRHNMHQVRHAPSTMALQVYAHVAPVHAPPAA